MFCCLPPPPSSQWSPIAFSFAETTEICLYFALMLRTTLKTQNNLFIRIFFCSPFALHSFAPFTFTMVFFSLFSLNCTLGIFGIKTTIEIMFVVICLVWAGELNGLDNRTHTVSMKDVDFVWFVKYWGGGGLTRVSFAHLLIRTFAH